MKFCFLLPSFFYFILRLFSDSEISYKVLPVTLFHQNLALFLELNTPSTSAPPPMNTLDQPNIIRDRSPTISGMLCN